MENEEINKAALLQSKAKIIADRNERFAIIEEEVESLKDEIKGRLSAISQKIEQALEL